MSASNGRFRWHELRAVDLPRAAVFYGGLFGWAAEESPTGYAFRLDDAVVGGASVVKPGLEAHWTPYVGVADVDVAARAATENGGIVTSGKPADVPGFGRVAPILDPLRTILAACRPLQGTGQPRIGGFVWERLRSRDPAVSAAFYHKVIGWNAILPPDGGSGAFETPDGVRVAELVAVDPSGQTGWLPFVGVRNLADARREALALGATAVGEPETISDVGTVAVITDPEGAPIAIQESSL